ncbi:molybdopterin cofactor-binding domain-containing protein [Qaidamihabitans albus]|uniref:molybdopterin cofactor-binding domain-containing protein n=1 Tax=Qaidamihabitans albus TaxID=2795733 RepID=UPI0018F21681|nr:molybdopterin cofactor-binding domain-containing protein [Qaidamihabitans albus]
MSSAFSTAFDLRPENVRIISPYLGGGFGAKGPTSSHTLLTVAAARLVGLDEAAALSTNACVPCTAPTSTPCSSPSSTSNSIGRSAPRAQTATCSTANGTACL